MMKVQKELFAKGGERMVVEYTTNNNIEPVEFIEEFIDTHKEEYIIPDICVFDVVAGDSTTRVGKLYDVVNIQHTSSSEVV